MIQRIIVVANIGCHSDISVQKSTFISISSLCSDFKKSFSVRLSDFRFSKNSGITSKLGTGFVPALEELRGGEYLKTLAAPPIDRVDCNEDDGEDFDEVGDEDVPDFGELSRLELDDDLDEGECDIHEDCMFDVLLKKVGVFSVGV